MIAVESFGQYWVMQDILWRFPLYVVWCQGRVLQYIYSELALDRVFDSNVIIEMVQLVLLEYQSWLMAYSTVTWYSYLCCARRREYRSFLLPTVWDGMGWNGIFHWGLSEIYCDTVWRSFELVTVVNLASIIERQLCVARRKKRYWIWYSSISISTALGSGLTRINVGTFWSSPQSFYPFF